MKFVRIICVVVLLAFISCQAQNDIADVPSVTYFAPENSDGLPFSKAVQVGNMLYLSGELGIDPETNTLAPGGIAAETRQTMENIAETLEKYGSSMDNVVKCTVMLADISEWEAMNAEYVTFFPDHFPARSAFGTTGLAMNARVEIECMAVVK
ncbi:MAG: RidA family protein [bacterium]|nr:RidA family protein [bacterium]